jgi:hypothetical protein
MKKVKIHKFCIPAESSVGPSRYRLFVAKADYDRVIIRIKRLEAVLEAKLESEDAFWSRYTPAEFISTS